MGEHDHAMLINSVGVAWAGIMASHMLGWLPTAVALSASIFTMVFYAIQIWESATVKRWRRGWGWTVPAEDKEI